MLEETMRYEVWLGVPGYENSYEVSNLGRVRAKAKDWICGNNAKRHKDAEILKQCVRRKYLGVILCKDGKPKSISVHRLVAMAFIPNIDNKPEVDHLDRNIYNNNADNLRWVTAKENCANRGGKYDRRN